MKTLKLRWLHALEGHKTYPMVDEHHNIRETALPTYREAVLQQEVSNDWGAVQWVDVPHVYEEPPK
jgi:hypothetical protein